MPMVCQTLFWTLGVAYSTDKANTASSRADNPAGTRAGRAKHRSYNQATGTARVARRETVGEWKKRRRRDVFRGREHLRQGDSKSDALRQREVEGAGGRGGGQDTDHLGP